MHGNEKISLKGWIYLTCFVFFIIAGIVVKRVFNHPELMAAFHLPAAAFLVLSGYDLTKQSRQRYKESCETWEHTTRKPS